MTRGTEDTAFSGAHHAIEALSSIIDYTYDESTNPMCEC